MLAQLTTAPSVSFSVLLELRSPELLTRAGHDFTVAAIVPMPEAAVNEDNLLTGRENEVGTSGKRPHVKPITIAEGMDAFTHHHFRFRVLAPNAGHAVLALFGR